MEIWIKGGGVTDSAHDSTTEFRRNLYNDKLGQPIKTCV
jgi:hypothetical protein